MQLIAQKEEFDRYIKASLSENTLLAYKADLKHFLQWGGKIPCSPELICRYLVVHADSLSPYTLSRRLVSIKNAHKYRGFSSPTNDNQITMLLRGIKRVKNAKQRQVSPVLKEHLIEMVRKAHGIKGCRDRAILLIGFAGAFRRSELVSIRLEDVTKEANGIIIHITRSKTDQEGIGRKVAIPYAKGAVCPVMALNEWLNMSGISDGPIFRPISRHGLIKDKVLSTQAVAEVVKQYAEVIGLDATNFSGHSLRAGLVTSAAQAGVSSWKIRQQTGHKNDSMLSRYIRDARLFVDNAVGAIL